MLGSCVGDRKLSNSDRSRRVVNNSNLGTAEDIPVALRDGRKPKSYTPVSSKKLPMAAAVMGAGVALSATLALNLFAPKTNNSPTVTPSVTNNAPSDRATGTKTEALTADNVLGHFPYPEAPSAQLVPIGGGLRLRTAGAKKYREMLAAARAAGVNITTISAFRSVTEQNQLFFGIGAARAQQPSKRAEVSAPPKHSEHHTGYAVDVGDANVPATNLNQNFDTTRAYKWLQANAARYGFELSFPQGNAQGVSYEPWHWRFVGDSDSLETFYKARQFNQK